MAEVPVLFSEEQTALDRLDPRARLLTMLAVIAFLFLAPTWPWLVGLLAVGILVAALARFRPKWLLVLWLVQTPNVLGLVLVPALVGLARGGLTAGDLEDGIRLSLAWLGAVSVLTPIVWTLSIDEIEDGLRGLHVPARVAFAVGYALRLLNVTLAGVTRTVDALKTKGVDLETRNPLRLLRALPKVTVPVVFDISRRANAMMAVLRMRGYAYDARPRRQRRVGVADVAVVALALLPVVAAAHVRFPVLPPAA